VSSLRFAITDARALAHAASPVVVLSLAIDNPAGDAIAGIVLRAQVQLEPRRRRYSRREEARLVELFGAPERWGETLRALLWCHVPVMVPAFTAHTEAEIHVPCSYDFDVACNKYLSALEDSTVPVNVLFSGTIFRGGDSGFQIEQIPWEMQASYQLPVAVIRAALDVHFPNSAWIRLRRDVFDDLYAFKTARGLPLWDDAIAALLDAARERQP
jgi:hypothetical protein